VHHSIIVFISTFCCCSITLVSAHAIDIGQVTIAVSPSVALTVTTWVHAIKDIGVLSDLMSQESFGTQLNAMVAGNVASLLRMMVEKLFLRAFAMRLIFLKTLPKTKHYVKS
jgi:hypothetical protein